MDKSVAYRDEALFAVLGRLAYSNRLPDLVFLFAGPASVLSLMINETIVKYMRFKHIILDLDHLWMDLPHLKAYSAATVELGAHFNRCFGSTDGTVRPICRPIHMH